MLHVLLFTYLVAQNRPH